MLREDLASGDNYRDSSQIVTIARNLSRKVLTRGENRDQDMSAFTSQKATQSQVYPEPTVGGLVVNKEGKILLTKSHKWYDKYTLPGGHIEVGETMKEAVAREVKEEVGLDVEVAELLLMQEAIFAEEFWKRKHFIFFDFLCRSKDQQVKLDGGELQEYVWEYPGAAFRLNLDSFTKKTIEKYLQRN
jgi:nucleoside triphosphatase